jgi:hypothetical protein
MGHPEMKKLLISLLLLFVGLAYADLNIELLGILEGENDGDRFGYCVANLGDINGDGYEDFGIGAVGCVGGGRVYISFGNEIREFQTDLILHQPPDVGWLGVSMCSMGDMDSDGADEFVVGALGGIFLFRGGEPPDTVPVKRFYEPVYYFGWSVASGDVNNDRFCDLAVTGGGPDSMYVYLGSEEMDTVADFVLSFNQIGMMGLATGDVNGDGYDDIIASAGVAGRTLLFFGRDSLYSEPDVIFDAIFTRGGVGDVNDDGYADIVAWYRLYFGGEQIDTSNYVILPKAKTTGRVGRINKDRYGDVIARNSDPAGSWAQAHIYLGGSELDSIEDWSSFRTSDNLGYSIAAVDINSDGVDEFILGDPYYLDDSRRGAAYVYSGDTTTLAVEDIALSLPGRITLDQNYPNPFNSRTVIEFCVSAGAPVLSSLKMYNSRGQLVKTLLETPLIPGRYQYVWDGTNKYGKEVSSGVYLITLDSGGIKRTRKALLIR